MNDEDKGARLAERRAREQREADLAYTRIRELHLNPIKGDFNAEHLKAVHAHIFQDLPHRRPGVLRENARNWTKHRALEGRSVVYDVPYASQDIEAKITNALEEFGGPEAIDGLTPHAAATRLAQVYGDLDHAGHFGNSRAKLQKRPDSISIGPRRTSEPRNATNFTSRAILRSMSGSFPV